MAHYIKSLKKEVARLKAERVELLKLLEYKTETVDLLLERLTAKDEHFTRLLALLERDTAAEQQH